ncbi:MAG: M15 family metallopeptidase, partial [Clostridia bacterium]|nr:M15 family metallopeptidase [Clostridia bacterium]
MKRTFLTAALICIITLTGCSGCGGDVSSPQSNTSGISPTDIASASDTADASTATTVTTTAAPTTTTTPPLPDDTELVLIAEYIPDIIIDLKYATCDNFTGVKIYESADAYLRYGTVKKLAAAAQMAESHGYRLKIWDAYRPVSAQYKLWDICPDPTYVSNPENGFSKHSRGNTVDITLVYSDCTDIPMPSGYDDFSSLADRDYSDVSSDARGNALLLESIMEECGSVGYFGEWWHYYDE